MALNILDIGVTTRFGVLKNLKWYTQSCVGKTNTDYDVQQWPENSGA